MRQTAVGANDCPFPRPTFAVSTLKCSPDAPQMLSYLGGRMLSKWISWLNRFAQSRTVELAFISSLANDRLWREDEDKKKVKREKMNRQFRKVKDCAVMRPQGTQPTICNTIFFFSNRIRLHSLVLFCKSYMMSATLTLLHLPLLGLLFFCWCWMSCYSLLSA